jgi:myosin-crossreactive antigen
VAPGLTFCTQWYEQLFPFGGIAIDSGERSMITSAKSYLVGGGIGSLAAAAFMIRDGGMPGANITIYESLPLLGGSLDGAGNPRDGYRLRGGRMLTTDNYECLWALYKTIPSSPFSPGIARSN